MNLPLRRRGSRARANHRDLTGAFRLIDRCISFLDQRFGSLLDPDVVQRSDPGAVARGGAGEVRGATDLAARVRGPRQGPRNPAGEWRRGSGVGSRTAASRVRTHDQKGEIAAIELVADPERLARMTLRVTAREELSCSGRYAADDASSWRRTGATRPAISSMAVMSFR